MESQLVREAQKRVQFVAEVYDYQSVHRDSPDGTWMPPTRHWVGDIFDTTMGRIYVPLDKYVRYPFYYDAKEGVDTADPRQIEYDFRYACSINKAVKIKEPPIDPSKDTDRKTLPSGFFKKDRSCPTEWCKSWVRECCAAKLSASEASNTTELDKSL